MDVAILELERPLMDLAAGHLHPKVLSEERADKARKYIANSNKLAGIVLEGLPRRISNRKAGLEGNSIQSGLKVRSNFQTDIVAPS
jgi:hypothetical protein